MAGNRTGKTEAGAYEMTVHLTGLYPHWWEGRKFKKPVKAWAAGDTSKTVRDILQVKLLGEPGRMGEGMIPGDEIIQTTSKTGITGAIDQVWVRHITGGISQLILKSYDQRREAFQGSEQDVIWLDEEADMSIWTECLMRTMTTDGLVFLTFTPLMGLTELVLQFMPGGQAPAAA